MKIGIAVDNTVPLHIPSFVAFVQAHSKGIVCHAIKSTFRFVKSEIEYEKEISNLSNDLKTEVKSFDISLLITAIPFDNNYFFEGHGELYIISLSDWHMLTTLPMSNGVAYMLCQIIVKYHMRIGKNHDDNTGCINDFWWDKSGVDVGMRAAFVCEHCKKKSTNNPYLGSDEFSDVVSILNAISTASRRGTDILVEPWGTATAALSAKTAPATFLCHNSLDKAGVRVLNEALRNAGVNTWLDEEKIQPGEIWQSKLESAISTIGSCLIIVGDSGFGPWQDMEHRAFINEFAKRGCKIIPILIGSALRAPELPLFLRQFMWVDLRADDGRQLAKLISALRGP